MNTSDLAKEIGEALLNSSDAQAIAKSLAELTIDELLDDGLLKKVPIVSWIVQAKQTYSSISDRLFLAKMAAFLLQLSQSESAREGDFCKKLISDPKAARRFNEMILLLLSRLDATQKAAGVAELSVMLLDGVITLPQFRRLCYALDSMFVDDLLEHGKVIRSAYNTTGIDDFRMLERYGLAKINEGKSKIYNRSTDTMEQCYDACLTQDGHLLYNAMSEVVRKPKG